MPKIISNKKKELARIRIRKKTERLIEQIGFKNVTITKICDEVPIGKGTFYYYYSSKELLLYEIIQEKEEKLMSQILSYTSENTTIEEKVIKVLTDVYIGTGSIVSIVTAEELERVIEKLPRELLHEKHLRGRNFFESSMKVLGIDPMDIDMDVLGELLDGINFISSRQSKHGEKAKKESLQVLIKGIAGYIASSSDGGK